MDFPRVVLGASPLGLATLQALQAQSVPAVPVLHHTLGRYADDRRPGVALQGPQPGRVQRQQVCDSA